jgi:hypothetical protein
VQINRTLEKRRQDGSLSRTATVAVMNSIPTTLAVLLSAEEEALATTPTGRD